MKILQFVVPENFNIFLFGDVHSGASASYEAGYYKMLDMVESEYAGCRNNYLVDHGDMVEAIMTDDRRYEAATTKESYILEQIHQAAKLRKLIADKLLAVLKGNHEAKLHRFGDVALEICRQIWSDDAEKHYGTYSCKINYLGAFKHYATHGRKGIGSVADDVERQLANQRIQLKRHLYRKFGDTLLNSKGHTHRLFIREPSRELYIIDDGKELHQRYKYQGLGCDGWIDPDSRWYVSTGSFLKTYIDGASTYSEMAEYDPAELGFCVAKWRGNKIEGIDKITI